MRARAQGVTLAIVMELCRFGNLFKVVEYARRVQRLPPDVRAGATPPRTPEEVKLRVRARLGLPLAHVYHVGPAVLGLHAGAAPPRRCSPAVAGPPAAGAAAAAPRARERAGAGLAPRRARARCPNPNRRRGRRRAPAGSCGAAGRRAWSWPSRPRPASRSCTRRTSSTATSPPTTCSSPTSALGPVWTLFGSYCTLFIRPHCPVLIDVRIGAGAEAPRAAWPTPLPHAMRRAHLVAPPTPAARAARRWEAKLADFNLSRALREGEAAAQLSQLINSPEWSAPERLAGQLYGKAADVFSFGVILYGAAARPRCCPAPPTPPTPPPPPTPAAQGSLAAVRAARACEMGRAAVCSGGAGLGRPVAGEAVRRGRGGAAHGARAGSSQRPLPCAPRGRERTHAALPGQGGTHSARPAAGGGADPPARARAGLVALAAPWPTIG